MVRTIIKPNKSMINLSIPSEYLGKEVEILIFPVNNADIQDKPVTDIDTFTQPIPIFGCLKGQIQMSDDFDEPLEDFKDYM